MRYLSGTFAVGTILLFEVASSQHSSNPLGTADQIFLDELAIKLHQQNPYDDLISEGSQLLASIAAENGYDVSSPILQRTLAQAMEELAFSSMQKAVNDDPAHPKIYSLLNPPRGSVPGGRYAYDNPDALYRTIPISSMYDYEIRGNRVGAGPADVSFSLRSNVNVPTNLAVLAGQDLVVEEDALEVETRSSDELPEPISEEEIVRKARTNFEESFPVYGQFLLGQQTLSQPQNIINAPVQQSFGTLATQANSFSHYNLSETDAIVITFNPGNSVYWVVPTTSLWMITDRPGERVESLNNAQAIPNANGTYTIVLSHSDPGVWNWVMASEGGVGTVMSRFQGFTAGSTQDSEIQIWSRVVPLNGVENVFPQDTKWVSQDEREAQLRERFASYDAVRGF